MLEEIIKKIQSGLPLCEEDLKILYKDSSPIFKSAINKYRGASYFEIKDLESSEKSFIFEMAKEFDLTKKIKFTTFIYHRTSWKILNIMNNVRMKNRSIEDTDVHLKHFESEDSAANEQIEALRNAVSALSKKEKLIIEQRFFHSSGEVREWRDIAKQVGKSVNYCIRLNGKAIKKLQSFLKNDDFESVQNLLSKT